MPRNDRAALTSYVAGLASAPVPGRAGMANVSQEVRRRMAVAAIKWLSVAAATGVTDGRVRFNLLNGWVAQKLLFADGGFTRKPVSRFWFRVIWPLLWQRRFLMPLSVQLYIVIGSRHRFAAGNWATYEEQDKFEFEEAPELSELVLPPELDAAVYVFRCAAA